MKKLYLVAALCLCLLLGACGAERPEDLFVPEGVFDENQVSEEAPLNSASDTGVPIAIEEGYYQYGNMQKGDPVGNFIVYGDEVLFTALQDGRFLLYSYNMSTGNVSLLCKDATCNHSQGDRDCLSGRVSGNLEQYQGNLYAMDRANQIVMLKDGSFDKVANGSICGFWHANGNLYAKTADHSLIVYENGSSTSRVLIDEYTELWNTVFGQYIYSGFGQGICRVDLSAEDPQVEVLVKDVRGRTDGEAIYYIDLKQCHLYRCRMDGSAPELLSEQPVHSGSLNFDDEYLYFRLMENTEEIYGEGSNVLYRMSKSESTQIEPIAELPEPIEEVYTIPGRNLLFIRTIDPGEMVDGYYTNGVRNYYVSNTDGSNLTLLELPVY